MKKRFNFSEYYHKFDDDRFTTIRGTNSAADYGIGQIVDIKVKRKIIGKARHYNYDRKCIKDIPLELLKKDAEYGDHQINSRQDFIDLINRFRRFHKVNSELECLVIHYLVWVEKI